MLETLKTFDKNTAAGILARTAFSIIDNENPACDEAIPNEWQIRSSVLSEIYSRLGIHSPAKTPEALDKITSELDSEAEALIGDIDQQQVLIRLSESGSLPSDLFEIQVVKNIEDFHGAKYERERKLINETVKNPDAEQNYGKADAPDQPFLISLYAKYFKDKYQYRGFTLLVAGQRIGLQFVIHQAWRIYPDVINLNSVNSLVELLEKFTNRFGVNFTVGSYSGKFLLAAGLPSVGGNTSIHIADDQKGFSEKKSKKEVTLSYFYQINPVTKENTAALVTAIDLISYKKFIRSRGW